MQINNNKPSFTGMYRVPYTPTVTKEIQEKVVPMYQYIRHRPVLIFEGRNPFLPLLDTVKGVVADANSTSKTWVEMNAKNHGVTLPNTDIDCVQVITGQDEIEKLMAFLNKRLEKYDDSFAGKIKRFFSRGEDMGATVELPRHLGPLGEGLKIYNAEANAYNGYVADKAIVNVKTPQELLAKMMTEK